MSIDKLTGTLVYVQLDTPKDCYIEEKGKEWKCSVVVDEETADEWDEAFPKQSAKQVKTADFADLYKIDAPYPEQRKQYIITLRKNTVLANGKEVPKQYQPKLYQRVNNAIVNVTHDVLVANGSEGTISVDAYEGKMGTFARLKNVMVTELIEYVKDERDTGGSEFGLPIKDMPNEFTESDNQQDEPQEPKKETKKSSKVTKKQEPENDPDDDEEPF